MKKIRTTAAVLMSVFIAAGCSRSDGDVSFVNNYEFTANVEEQFVFSDVGIDESEGIINAFSVMDDSKTALIIVSEEGEHYFAVYENGKQIIKTEIPDIYQEMCYNAAEKCFYTYDVREKQIHIMDADFKFKEVLADNFEVSEIKNMDVVDNKLYLIAVKESPYDYDEQANAFDEETGYYNFGEKAYSIDLAAKDVKDLGIRNVICQSYSNGTLYYYTCRDGHYSLDIYDRETKTLNAVKNTDETGYIFSFAIIGEEMIYVDFMEDKLTRLNLNTGNVLFEPGITYILRNSDFEVYKGSLIILNRDNMSISRCGGNTGTYKSEKLAQFNGESLVIGTFSARYVPINTSNISAECGISTSIYEYPMYDDEIKLKLLAGDSDVDIYIFSSARRTGIDIRKMGCYVPLTDESILGERSQYFDWLADYTVTDNGDIWCVPIYTSTDATFYVPENLEALGIKAESLATFDGYFSALETVKTQDNYKFYGATIDFADAMDEKYKANYGYLDFSNEIYSNMFERIYSGWLLWSDPNEGKAEHPLFNNIATSPDAFQKSDADNMAFEIAYTSTFYEDISDPNDWCAMPLPTISSLDEKNPITVDYAIINPFSKKKEAAEAYLGFIAENNLKFRRDKSFLYKDKALCGELQSLTGSCFDGLYDMMENGTVYEALLPVGEDFRGDVIAYQNGEMTLDEYIAKLERVSEMTANE
ncbi:MAG: extracellular solute-binding protein [Lachnospiraceae bacterium]|nr:extracellular solute-binding protein [Ruminococcus sp.]MCM1276184.1 extracellular solute-binding protein [Lachnospiraceae bacterium]